MLGLCTALRQQELTWPRVPLAVRVTSACDPWARSEENVSPCRSWDMVLACVGVFVGASQASFRVRGPATGTAVQTPPQQKMLCLCFPREQRVQNISVWQEVQKDIGLPERGRFPTASA